MTQYPTRHSKPQKSPVGTMVLSWLLPGYGFFRNGYKGRAIFFFVVLQLTFLLGAALRGSVLVPDFSPGSPTFNLVNILTFFVQLFNGGLAFISMLPDLIGPGAAILPYQEDYVYADLGAFFLLVSGGMNYFVLVKTWDHFYARKADVRAVEPGS